MNLRDKARQEAQKIFGGSMHKYVTEQFKAYELGYTHCFEQLNKPVVMQGLELNLPSMGEVSDAIEMLAKKSTAPDVETPDWLKADIRNGINWALNYVTKHNTSPTVGKAGGDASVSDGK